MSLIVPGLHTYVVGTTGSGKSYWLRSELEPGDYHLLVWDPEDEYTPGLSYGTTHGAMAAILRAVERGHRGVAAVHMPLPTGKQRAPRIGELAHFVKELGEDGHPCILVVEEAGRGCGEDYCDDRTTVLATEGRKREAGLVLVSQALARHIQSDIMSVVRRIVVFQLTDHRCLELARQKWGPATRDRIRALPPFQSWVWPDDLEGAHPPPDPVPDRDSPPLPEDGIDPPDPPRVCSEENPRPEVGEGTDPGDSPE